MARFEISPNIGNISKTVDALVDYANGLDERITEVAANIPSKMIVEELPEEGDPNITYYVGPKGTAPNLYYEVWVWVQEVEDGPFVWRELEDTDQVDLSGYLPKKTNVTTYSQFYAKTADGSQDMYNFGIQRYGSMIPQRDTNGDIYVPDTPALDICATSKKYVDSNFIAKDTTTTPYSKVYIKKTDGTQDTLSMASTPNAGFVVQYNTGGTLRCKDPTGNGEEVVNLGYANDKYLAKQTGSTSYAQVYAKATDGTQTMITVQNGAGAGTIPLRDGSGQLTVPATPTSNNHAASKAYVDASVGQLIYHHDMVILYTLTGDSDYVKIAAHSDNNSSTAYTSLGWQMNQLVMPDYAIYHHGSYDYLASVTKLPRGLHQDEFSEPQDGFLLTYWDGSSLQNVRVNGSLFNTPTVTDVVTTW